MGPGVIPMSAYAEDVRVISCDPVPAPAPADGDVSPVDTAAETGHSDCPYCGDTGRDQVRQYRFCGHDAP